MIIRGLSKKSDLDPLSSRETIPELRYTSEEWKLEGICRTADPEQWFPDLGSRPTIAKKLCAKCPVIDNCLADALSRREKFGVWGGLSERERRKLVSMVAAQVRAEKYHKE